MGSFAVVVDPIDKSAAMFYQKFDFISLPDSKKCSSPFKLFSNYSDNMTLNFDQKTNFKLSILLLSLFAFMLLVSGCSLFPNKSSSQKTETIQEGDLLFQDLNCGELCDAIEAVTEGVDGKDFSHCAMVVKINDTLQVVEAIGDKVQVTSLRNFFARSGDTTTIQNITVGRVLEKYQPLAAKAALNAKAHIGEPYDDVFLMNNNSWYCSELLYDAFKEANDSKDFFELN